MASQTQRATQAILVNLQLQDLAVRLNKTPTLLRIAFGGICVLAALLSYAVHCGTDQHLGAIKTVESDATPSIVAAQGIKANVADMHSNAANEFLLAPGKAPQAVTDYEKRRTQVSEDLIKAARNITYEKVEVPPVRTLLNGLGAYEELIGEARALHQKGDAGFVAKHREADKIVHTQLLPAADQLAKVNQDELNTAYASHKASEAAAIGWVVFAALCLLGALGGLQYFLFRRMRRVLNPALLAATVTTAAFWTWAAIAFSGATNALKVAKEDAFQSIGVLAKARADAYDANGDESRWLLEVLHDTREAKAYEDAFRQKADRVATRPERLSDDALVQEIGNQLKKGNRAAKVPGFAGYVAEELGNITFRESGEDKAALETLRTFLAYRKVDEEIRRLENENKYAEAVALCTGTKPGQSNWAFQQFDDALTKTIDVNQVEFNKSLAFAKGALAGLHAVGPLVVALVVVGLTGLGLWPRVREYAIN